MNLRARGVPVLGTDLGPSGWRDGPSRPHAAKVTLRGLPVRPAPPALPRSVGQIGRADGAVEDRRTVRGGAGGPAASLRGISVKPPRPGHGSAHGAPLLAFRSHPV